MAELSSLLKRKTLNDEELERNLRRFASEYPTQKDCCEFLCNLVEPIMRDQEENPLGESEEEFYAQTELSETERDLLNQLSKEALHADDLANQTKLSESSISATITRLEWKELIIRLPGDRYKKPDERKTSPQKPCGNLSPS